VNVNCIQSVLLPRRWGGLTEPTPRGFNCYSVRRERKGPRNKLLSQRLKRRATTAPLAGHRRNRSDSDSSSIRPGGISRCYWRCGWNSGRGGRGRRQKPRCQIYDKFRTNKKGDEADRQSSPEVVNRDFDRELGVG